jgi:DNA polymerase I-like protein with 3'-5' exonuclease and polymerase domains
VAEDLHLKRACEIFGCKPEEVTPEQRRYAKQQNYFSSYGPTGRMSASEPAIQNMPGTLAEALEMAFAKRGPPRS